MSKTAVIYWSGTGNTEAMASAMASEVFARVTREEEIISTSDVRDCVYALLNEKSFPGTAKCYWEYKSRK